MDRDEQLNILNELAKPDLSDDEVKTIEYLRNNNATIQDVIEYYSQKAVQDYINQNGPVKMITLMKNCILPILNLSLKV